MQDTQIDRVQVIEQKLRHSYVWSLPHYAKLELVTFYLWNQPCFLSLMNTAVFQNCLSFSVCQVGDHIKPELCLIQL